jgi:hypothetical protein
MTVMPIWSLGHIKIGPAAHVGARDPVTELVQRRYQGIINGRADDEFGWLSHGDRSTSRPGTRSPDPFPPRDLSADAGSSAAGIQWVSAALYNICAYYFNPQHCYGVPAAHAAGSPEWSA